MCAALQTLSARARDIEKAAAIVKRGGIVAYPTDTVYGLGCDPHNPRAIRRAMAVKGRRGKKPFPILVISLRMGDQIAVMDRRAKILASMFWPGPLTLVLKSRVRFPNALTMGRKSIAVRCPNDRVALGLIRKCGGLLTGTSANLSGKPPCTSAKMVRRCFGDRIDAVLDGGQSSRRVGSTVVRINSRGVRVLREGPIRNEQVKQALSVVFPHHERR